MAVNVIDSHPVVWLESEDGYISVAFTYFMERLAPVSKSRGMQGYDVAFIGKKVNGKYTFVMEVSAMGTNLCPCSKEISKYGAHNQRNTVRVRLQGACRGCPGAQMTLKMGVERLLKEKLPEVKEVVAV